MMKNDDFEELVSRVREAGAMRGEAQPSPATWIVAGCDNRPAMFVLASLLKADSRTTRVW